MQRKFGMTVSAVYCFISKEGIPKMKIGRETLYSKTHVDAAKGLIKKRSLNITHMRKQWRNME